METLTCPHCAAQITTDGAIDQPDSRTTICHSCKQRYSLGSGRQRIAAPPALEVKKYLCKFCRAPVDWEASKCPHCQEWLREDMRPRPIVHATPTNQPSLGVAAVLSFVIPGLGQVYKGQIFDGIVWLFLVAFGYVFFIVPGLLLHIVCVVGASRPIKNKKSA